MNEDQYVVLEFDCFVNYILDDPRLLVLEPVRYHEFEEWGELYLAQESDRRHEDVLEGNENRISRCCRCASMMEVSWIWRETRFIFQAGDGALA